MAREDQGRNEAESSNAAIGYALVNGGPLKRQYHEMFDGNKETLVPCTLEEFEAEKERGAEENAWSACDYVRERIKDPQDPVRMVT